MDTKLARLVGDIRSAFSGASIWLFGSRVRGDATAASDYDLIIVSSKFSRFPFVNRAGEVWRHSDVILAADLLCYTPAEFRRASKTSLVLRDALRYAVPL